MYYELFIIESGLFAAIMTNTHTRKGEREKKTPKHLQYQVSIPHLVNLIHPLQHQK
jgi:hypothetical protein